MVIKRIIQDTLYEIKLNFKQFVLITIALIISFSFYIGLNSFSKIMENNSENYYKETNLMDLKLVSTMGLSKDDLIKIKSLEEVKGITLVKSLNTKASIKDKDYVIKVNSINKDRSKKNDDYINRLILLSGRYPRTINEGLVEEKLLKENNVKIGDLITLMPENDSNLRAKKIKIVGTVKNNYYSNDKEINSKNNKVDYHIYIEENDFNINYYTEGYVTLKNSNQYNTNSKKYEKYLDNNKAQILNIISESTKSKYDFTVEDLKSSINDIESSLNALYESEVPQNLLGESIKEMSNELNNYKNTLNSIPSPKSYVLKRSEIKSLYDYKIEVKKINKTNRLFSILFLLTGLLISIGLICNIINKEKDKINIFYYTGYTKMEISIRYVLYTLFSSLIGCIMSILFSKAVLKMLLSCYDAYEIPSLSVNVQNKYILYVLLLNIVSMMLAFTILYFKPFYNVIKKNVNKFINKSNNIIKVLIKFKMEIVLVCVLSSTLIMCFGTKNLINKSINTNYKKIHKYDALLNINENISKEDLISLENKFIKNKEIDKTILISKNSIAAQFNNYNTKANIIIVPVKEKINNFINLKGFNNKGITITYKLAKELNIKTNDKITINIDKKKYKVKVYSVIKDYINSDIYMSDELYKNLTNNDICYNVMLVKSKSNTALNYIIDNESNITSYDLAENQINNYSNSIKSLKNIMNVVTISEVIILLIYIYLALEEIINSRKKDILTIKNTETCNKEIIKCMCTKTFIISLVSYLISIILGTLLTYFIICYFNTNEYIIKFGVSIYSFILAFIVIMMLNLVSNIVMYYKIKKI